LTTREEYEEENLFIGADARDQNRQGRMPMPKEPKLFKMEDFSEKQQAKLECDYCQLIFSRDQRFAHLITKTDGEILCPRCNRPAKIVEQTT